MTTDNLALRSLPTKGPLASQRRDSRPPPGEPAKSREQPPTTAVMAAIMTGPERVGEHLRHETRPATETQRLDLVRSAIRAALADCRRAHALPLKLAGWLGRSSLRLAARTAWRRRPGLFAAEWVRLDVPGNAVRCGLGWLVIHRRTYVPPLAFRARGWGGAICGSRLEERGGDAPTCSQRSRFGSTRPPPFQSARGESAVNIRYA
jgi:hypothetical protein